MLVADFVLQMQKSTFKPLTSFFIQMVDLRAFYDVLQRVSLSLGALASTDALGPLLSFLPSSVVLGHISLNLVLGIHF